MQSHSYISLLLQRALSSHPPKVLLIQHNDRLLAEAERSWFKCHAGCRDQPSHRLIQNRALLSEPTATNGDDARTKPRGCIARLPDALEGVENSKDAVLSARG